MVSVWGDKDNALANHLAQAWNAEPQAVTSFKGCIPETLHIVLLEDGNGSIELPSTCGAQMVVILLGTWADDQLRKLYWLDSHIVDAQNTTLHHVSSSAALDSANQAVVILWSLQQHFDLPSILRWPTVSLPPLNAMSEQSNLEDLRDLFYTVDPPVGTDPLSRLALAKAGRDLTADGDPWIRARSMLNVDSHSTLSSGIHDGSSLVRLAAVQQLVNLSRHHPIESFQRLLETAAGHSDAYMRWKAAHGLRHYPASRPILESLLWDPDIDVQRSAALSLGEIGASDSLGPLKRIAKSPNSFVRRWSVAALANIEETEDSFFKTMLKDSSRLVALEAHRALVQRGQGGPEILPYLPPKPPEDNQELQELLDNTDPTVRKDAFKFLLLNPPSADALVPYLTDPDSDVRKMVALVLGWVPNSQALLQQLLNDADPDVLVTTLCALARQPLAQVEPLLAWTNHPDAEVRLRAIEALSMVENSEAKVWLAKHVKDDDERIRAAVLSRLPELLTSDEPSMWVRCMAMANGADIDGPWCPHQNGDWGHFGQGVVAAEDDFLHSLFSWNSPEEKPEGYRLLRPRSFVGYGQPDRG
ncbi:MAG: HEAT repeat domain-containing protein [Myxococcota bacterium]|nr:HEAT repeat domain-containing protein [Myxococcota bacterium]